MGVVEEKRAWRKRTEVYWVLSELGNGPVYSFSPGKLRASGASNHFSSACSAPEETFRKRTTTCPLIYAHATSASTSKGTLTSGSINFRRDVAPLGNASRNISAMPPSLTLVLEAFNSLLAWKMLTGIFTGWRKYRRRSRTMKFKAALKQRDAFKALMGFCRTKFAPIPNACCVVVFLPLRMAKLTELLLLGVARKPSNSAKPPRRSSQ